MRLDEKAQKAYIYFLSDAVLTIVVFFVNKPSIIHGADWSVQLIEKLLMTPQVKSN